VLGKKAHGMAHLMRTMEGGAVGRYVLVSGRSFDAINRYLDAMRASTEYTCFHGKVSANA
jgi:hypothetical protein